MKNYLSFLALTLLIFAWLPSQTKAEGSWWNKGLDIIKNVSEKTDPAILEELSSADIGEAFKQALRMGTENVVNQLGAPDGFSADPLIHIPLPEELKTVKTVLAKVGMSQMVDDLELKLNRAAESATPKAKDLFLQAITEMTFADIQTIYKGPNDSATKYFQSKMSANLKLEMQPIVDNTLSQVGTVQAYDNVVSQYKTLPFVPDVKANLTDHVLQKGMEGIFYYMAKEEASIRENPAQQTTALLKKVFGGQ